MEGYRQPKKETQTGVQTFKQAACTRSIQHNVNISLKGSTHMHGTLWQGTTRADSHLISCDWQSR